MDVVERLTLEAAQAQTMIASEHRQRYELAASLCAGLRVLDLCCGSGYGAAILSRGGAAAVLGVDRDLATIETAGETVGRRERGVCFQAADAVAFLGSSRAGEAEAIVCFEGLEHLEELERALELLLAHARRGARIVASVPNGGMLREANPFHVTEFGLEQARAAFSPFPAVTMLTQFLAEGSLILSPEGAGEPRVEAVLGEREHPAYANHFIFCSGFEADAVRRACRGRLWLSASPLYNEWAEGIKRGYEALRRENARLARAALGKAGSAAASALAVSEQRERQVAELAQRARVAERTVVELQARLDELRARRGGAPAGGPPAGGPAGAPAAGAPAGAWREFPLLAAPAVPVAPGEDPNSWEHRRRRAAEVLLPWVERTVPLAGRTVLEYGCGNGAVSCAVAERAGRLIGLDIDAAQVRQGQAEAKRRGLGNVELRHHPLESILDAFAAQRGKVDVVLLYAVLEHCTIAERLEILRIARELAAHDGAIVVCETPNRLIYFDHHTAQMPFFHLLGDELAGRYFERAPRAEMRAAFTRAAGEGRLGEALVRWGRGASFHEFELAFPDGLERHVLASNYDPLLFGERPIQPDEVILARYLERWRPDLAPVFSRYWLDLILSPSPRERVPAQLRPWAAETVDSAGAGWTREERIRLRGAGARLLIELPCPSTRLVLGAARPQEGPLALYARPEGAAGPLRAEGEAEPLRAEGYVPFGAQVFATFDLSAPSRRIVLQPDRECELVFVGYEA
jgi:2-polyprenyl-3-methyl-5-hydroxy-6-metoxy-1,4-benzoquinol methylase